MYHMTNRKPPPVVTYAMQKLTPESSERVTANIRAVMGRDQVKPGELAVRLGKPRPWLHRRLGDHQALTTDDIALIADALFVPVAELMGPES
jgi:hypothetical protein